MCNSMVSHFKRNEKIQRNEIQSRYEQADPSISEQADHSTSGSIRVEHIRDGARRSDQKELRERIRFDLSGVKANGGKTRQIGAEREHHGEREKSCSKRENKA